MRIAIIGGGLSGSLLTIQLCRQAGQEAHQIILIEKSGAPGLGVAYGTSSEAHLLNVRAMGMSALPEEPQHFVNWLSEEGFPYGAADFVPRGVYGQYVRSLLETTLLDLPPHLEVLVVEAEVVQLGHQNGVSELTLSNGDTLTADQVVLALGNYPPAHPFRGELHYTQSPHYVADPWAPGLFEQLSPEASVLLVGSGLTMVDMVMSLTRRQHRGRISCVSLHGYLPMVHQPVPAYTGLTAEMARQPTARHWLLRMRAHLRQAAAAGLGWRSVIDAHRPYTQLLWLNWPVREKLRFLQHLGPLWGISRHRMAPESAAVMEQLLKAGQLELIAGRLEAVTPGSDGLEVQVKLRQSTERQTLKTQLLVNCTGPESNYERVPSPLVRDLLDKGLLRPDPLGMGIDATPEGRVLNSAGQAADWLFTLGPPLKGILWECTAAPEIRVQAAELANRLLSAELTAQG